MAKEECQPYIRPLSIDNRQSGESLSFRVFRGNVQLSVFGKERGTPPFSASLNDTMYNMLRKLIKKIKDSAPDTKIPMKKEKFDPNTKQWTLEWVIALQKDSKMCYHIVLTNCKNNASFDFLLKGVGGISIGAEPLSDAGKSGIQLDVVEQWLERSYMLAAWSDEKFDPSKARGGNGGGGNNNGGNAPPADGGNEDMPW